MGVSQKTSPEIDGRNNWKPPKLDGFFSSHIFQGSFQGFPLLLGDFCGLNFYQINHSSSTSPNLDCSGILWGGFPSNPITTIWLLVFFAEKHGINMKKQVEIGNIQSNHRFVHQRFTHHLNTFDGNYSDIY